MFSSARLVCFFFQIDMSQVATVFGNELKLWKATLHLQKTHHAWFCIARKYVKYKKWDSIYIFRLARACYISLHSIQFAYEDEATLCWTFRGMVQSWENLQASWRLMIGTDSLQDSDMFNPLILKLTKQIRLQFLVEPFFPTTVQIQSLCPNKPKTMAWLQHFPLPTSLAPNVGYFLSIFASPIFSLEVWNQKN